MRLNRHIHSGFTLVEMIMVIIITGIIGAIAAVFLKAPVQQYLDVARRAEMTDIADTALRRIGRDIRTAVPNSVRLSHPDGSTYYLEFLPTRTGGRYRETATDANACSGVPGDAGGDALSFGYADTCFGIIGPEITFTSGEQIVLGSTQPDGDLPYDNTASGVLRAYNGTVGAAQSRVVMAGVQFSASAEVQGHRFVVVPGDQQAVTYSCESIGVANGEGTGKLRRYWNYWPAGVPIKDQPAPSFPPSNGFSAILADKISNCNIVYGYVNKRLGLVEIMLGITHGGESISLYHEIHVNNAP